MKLTVQRNVSFQPELPKSPCYCMAVKPADIFHRGITVHETCKCLHYFMGVINHVRFGLVKHRGVDFLSLLVVAGAVTSHWPFILHFMLAVLWDRVRNVTFTLNGRPNK
jgi:hypothetical protein